MSGVREATLTALDRVSITRHLGRPTQQAIKLSRREIGIEYAAAKTTHEDFPMGTRFGYASAILTPKQFTNAHNRVCEAGDELEDDWELLIPTRPATTNPAINDDTSETDAKKLKDEWKVYIAE